MTRVISIDGPSYVGKSTIAQNLSAMTGHTYVNSGHMYRAVAKACLDFGCTENDQGQVLKLASGLNIEFVNENSTHKTVVNGADWTGMLQKHEIVFFASKIAVFPDLRSLLTKRQREYADSKVIIMEGRDIGSVVFPDALWKFYVTASAEIRAQRMFKVLEAEERKKCGDYTNLIPKIMDLDKADMTRKIAPLRVPDHAIIYDNSASPCELWDAVILNYYINQSNEIVANSEILRSKSFDREEGVWNQSLN